MWDDLYRLRKMLLMQGSILTCKFCGFCGGSVHPFRLSPGQKGVKYYCGKCRTERTPPVGHPEWTGASCPSCFAPWAMLGKEDNYCCHCGHAF
jgi:hypothetical protein